MGGQLESGKKQAIEQGNSSSNAADDAASANVDKDAVAERMRELRGEH